MSSEPLGAHTDRLTTVRARQLPQHIAIIMDGNGRWAEGHGLRRTEGHRRGMETAERTAEFIADELDIPYLTLFAFSTENWRRPPAEVDYLMGLIRQFLDEKVDKLMERGARLRVLGNLEGLTDSLQQEIRRAEGRTAHNDRFQLNIAFNYGGRQEILRAVESIVRDKLDGRLNGAPLDEDVFKRYLYTADIPDPDLLIRTSGEERVSNFLLWQIAYAEFWVTEALWPDFTPDHLLAALETYGCRSRKYGSIPKT